MNAVEYGLQVYGFLIQTLPVALLWYVPFSKERLRVSGRRLYWLLAGSLAALAIGFALLSGLLMMTGEMRVHMRSAANLYMGIALLLEAGAQTNTVQEVKNAMEPFADILDRVLSGETRPAAAAE